MGNPTSTDDWQKILPTLKLNRYERFGHGGDGSKRLVFLCLGLLNVVLMIAAVVIGLHCAKVRDSSLQVSHSASAQLISELEYLRSNYSEAIKGEEEAKNTLQRALKETAELKVQIEQQKPINDNYQRQIEALQTEKNILQFNISSYEGSCGKCLPGWVFLNSSCYFFSFTELSTVKKNWQDSRADCISRGADLIVINTQEEQNATINYFRKFNKLDIHGRPVFWIGLRDFPEEGIWKWVDGTALVGGFWNDGKPNNNSNNDCGTVLENGSILKAWNDVKCHTQQKWICEKAPNNVD